MITLHQSNRTMTSTLEQPQSAATLRAPPQSPLRLSTTPAQLVREEQNSFFTSLDTAGFYETDRILKSGQLNKRQKHTKSWKPVQLVLRRAILSIYKDEAHTQLKHQIKLQEITAVELRKDKSGRQPQTGRFDLYTLPRNFHFEAGTNEEAALWVQLIKQEARAFDEDGHKAGESRRSTTTRPRTVSNTGSMTTTTPAIRIPRSRNTSASSDTRVHLRSTSANIVLEPPRISADHSATDVGSFSDFSDFSDEPMFGSVGDLPVHRRFRAHSAISSAASIPGPDAGHETSQSEAEQSPRKPFYMLDPNSEDERVVCHGFLQCLKSRGGVRHWKRYWAVLRKKSLALYKSEEVGS